MEGRITADEMFDANQQILNHPRLYQIKYGLIIARNISEIKLNEMDLVDIAADDRELSKTLKDVKVPIVASNPEIRKLAKFYIDVSWKLNNSWHFRIFDTEAEARDWLHLDMHPNTL